jgi:hypothetical protein
MLVLLLQTIHT